MRKILSLLIIFALGWSIFGEVLFAQRSEPAEAPDNTKVIDLTADIVYPTTLSDGTEVMCLVGNFAAQHNGAIITADSAVRYNDKRLECFGNVLINKNTTYAYADRADYNGEINEVNLYAPIIKIVDGAATMWSYNFSFNTLSNIGVYEGGGVMINEGSVMESVVGYYYSDTKELIGVGDVELRGDEYEMKADSVIYNTETDYAQYFENTHIWNQKDEYLYADAGDYDKSADRYSFSLNGYILTQEQEIWSDSLDYFRATEHIFMRHNIQIDDTTQKSLIFGDFGEYIKTPGDITLVGNPQLISYDAEQGDSLFMRADTFRIFTLNRFLESDSVDIVSATDMAAQTIAAGEDVEVEEHDHAHDHTHGHDHAVHKGDNEEAEPQSEPIEKNNRVTDDNVSPSIGTPRVEVGSQERESEPADSLATDSLKIDSLQVDSLQLDSLRRAADTLNFFQRIKRNYLEKKKIRDAEKLQRDAARKVVLDSIGRERQIIINAKLDAEKVRQARQAAQRQMKMAERKARKLRRDVARGKISAEDTLAMMQDLAVDTSYIAQMESELEQAHSDSLAVDSLAVDSLAVDSLAIADTVKVDSLYRLTKGYRNVKIYRSDFQAVADSMVSSSLDSIIRLYINPVLWHDVNQVTSDVMDIYTANNQIMKAIFTGGSPIMASEVTPDYYYNQVAGKVITSLFSEGAIYRNDADGNAQTLYFMQDDETQEVNGLMVMESGSTTFYIEEQSVTGITYRSEPVYTIYPMEKIPETQEFSLKGFVWQQENRPTQEEVFDRTIRPTEREKNSALERPLFPIREELDEHRADLIRNRSWVDRNEVVSPAAEAWMESLGYKTGQPRQEAK